MDVLMSLLAAVLRELPGLIASSKAMSEAEKKVALDKLALELETAKARVAAMTFRDV